MATILHAARITDEQLKTRACGHSHSGSHTLTATNGRRHAECAGCLTHYTAEEVIDATGRPGQRGIVRL